MRCTGRVFTFPVGGYRFAKSYRVNFTPQTRFTELTVVTRRFYKRYGNLSQYCLKRRGREGGILDHTFAEVAGEGT